MSTDKRLRRWRSSSSSSQEVVLNDENLLTLILLRVPCTKLKVLKCVSRQWRSVITASHFRNLLPPLRASGLFVQPGIDVSCPNKVYFVPLDDPNAPSPFGTLGFCNGLDDYGDIRILQSCNGLLLCSTASGKHYVCNPETNQLAALPKHPLDNGKNFLHVGLAFDPSKSSHYKVIGFVSKAPPRAHCERDFYIYSSETETWKSSVRSFVLAPGMCFSKGVYWNGCIHWLGELDSLLEPDLSVFVSVYFDVDKERLGTFPRPPIVARSRSLYFGESEGHLHVIEASPRTISLSVYEMKTDYSMWLLKNQIDLDPISEVFPEIKEKSIFEDETDYQVDVLSLIRRESFHEDSFLVLKIPGKVIRYNLVDRSFTLLWDFGVDLDFDPKINDYSLCEFKVCQYFKSLSCV